METLYCVRTTFHLVSSSHLSLQSNIFFANRLVCFREIFIHNFSPFSFFVSLSMILLCHFCAFETENGRRTGEKTQIRTAKIIKEAKKKKRARNAYASSSKIAIFEEQICKKIPILFLCRPSYTNNTRQQIATVSCIFFFSCLLVSLYIGDCNVAGLLHQRKHSHDDLRRFRPSST